LARFLKRFAEALEVHVKAEEGEKIAIFPGCAIGLMFN